MTCEPWWMPCSTSPRRVSVALPPGVVRSMDAGLVAVPPLVSHGTWAQVLTVLHALARIEDGRTDETPLDGRHRHPPGPRRLELRVHLPRPRRTLRPHQGKRVVAVDVTGLPVAAMVLPASTHENPASELMLEHVASQGVTNRLELVLEDRGVTAAAPRRFGPRTRQESSIESRTPGRDGRLVVHTHKITLPCQAALSAADE